MAVIAEAFRQSGFQSGAHRTNIVQQPIVANHALHFQRRGAGDRVA